jgi:hypothetical protein
MERDAQTGKEGMFGRSSFYTGLRYPPHQLPYLALERINDKNDKNRWFVRKFLLNQSCTLDEKRVYNSSNSWICAQMSATTYCAPYSVKRVTLTSRYMYRYAGKTQ